MLTNQPHETATFAQVLLAQVKAVAAYMLTCLQLTYCQWSDKQGEFGQDD